ncbi:GNAT family N-acetyltransferase [Limnohabitans sp. JUR4]|uniref:GNAT family N-acetyltransferase n=2 Tax=Limnohabitans radicicola TaxID=2771427 RepID=A0A927IL25_9BURK|nr:GNAT family N-acetyltransferase [Limnohabitans radicicola]MBD8049715.1 GNAT family N-acetyltransferase [Limnohabitans radicicola]
MKLHCEPLSPADIPQACDLFAEVFGHSTVPAHWIWKYQQGPRLAGLNLIIRNTEGQLVGHVGASVFAGQTQGRRLPMAQLSDVMVAPSARGSFDSQGVYAQLMRSMEQTLQAQFPGVFAYGFVGIRPYRLGSRMGLYKSQHECRAGLMAAGQPAGWRDWFCTAQAIDWPEAFESKLFERVWQSSAPRIERPTLVRNSDYMRWRYAQHPQHTYQLWVIRSWGQTQGWVVTRCMPSGQHTVIDLLPAQPGSMAQASTRRALSAVGRVLQARQPQDPVTLSAWNIQTPESQQLEPIIGVEFRVGQWHTLLQPPVFVPGDTDVF